jgi:hypothetical protein
MLKRIFGHRRKKHEDGKVYIMKKFVIYALYQT